MPRSQDRGQAHHAKTSPSGQTEGKLKTEAEPIVKTEAESKLLNTNRMVLITVKNLEEQVLARGRKLRLAEEELKDRQEQKLEWLEDSHINVSQLEWLEDNQHNKEELLHYIQEQEQHIREEQAIIRSRKLRLARAELKQRRELKQEMGWLEYNQQAEEELQKNIQELRLHEEGQQERVTVSLEEEKKLEAELQELSSALMVDRLAEAELAEQDGLEEQSSDQKIGANLKKKTEAVKEEPEEAGDMKLHLHEEGQQERELSLHQEGQQEQFSDQKIGANSKDKIRKGKKPPDRRASNKLNKTPKLELEVGDWRWSWRLKLEAELQKLSSALMVDRLAEAKLAELAEQAGLEEKSSDQKIGANLKKKTETEKEEPEEQGSRKYFHQLSPTGPSWS